MREFIPAGSEQGWRRRPLAGALGLRPPVAHRPPAEWQALERHAAGARCAVEVGVDEGTSARRIRRVIDPAGVLFLIDAFPPGRLGINLSRVIARRTVGSVPRGRVVWVRKWSEEAAVGWDRPIDFVLIDADRSFDGVSSHWDDWNPHVPIGGKVMLAGARIGDGSWVPPGDGPARLFDAVIASDPRWRLADEACASLVVERTRCSTGGQRENALNPDEVVT